jgi:hypothetical protein
VDAVLADGKPVDSSVMVAQTMDEPVPIRSCR